MQRFEGKTVLVTGSAGGLGREFALTFAREGATLILADINEEGLAETKSLVEEAGSSASRHRVDLSDEADLHRFAQAVLADTPKLDVLINNAGLAYGEIAHGFLGVGMEKWQRWFAINSIAPLLLAEALKPALAAAQGLVINQSSMASFTPATAYGVTKATLNAMTFGMANQFARDQIRVVGIAPGLMETEANRASLPPETYDRVKGMQLTRRQGTAKDIANFGLFLASEEGSFINNEVVLVDGGNQMRGWRL
ncbi:SDR family NAD(P)-dependent oxidoreductase [Stakelama tenebrarum]|uniref:SDR family NAD(P)-dependent oxidoreductase n=1 Tax=Stakelama tenebrarum TaxID=2711215 RepID=UPI001D18CB91|nr:SDR family oxidoreductase [Sphingosinithalassobacter tenebrarum]